MTFWKFLIKFCIMRYVFVLLVISTFCSTKNFVFSDESLISTEVRLFRDGQGGVPPNDNDFFLLLRNSSLKSILEKQPLLLLKAIASQQSPKISISSLISMQKAKRNTIRDFRCLYTLDVNDKREPQYKTVRKCEFAFSGNKLLTEIDHRIPGEAVFRIGFDGNNIIKSWKNHLGYPQAALAPIEKQERSTFSQVMSPINLSLLFDLSLCDMPNAPRWDIIQFLHQTELAFVLEKPEVVQKIDCLVLVDMSSRIYLDPNRDFSVIMIEFFELKFDGDVCVSRWLEERTVLSDLKDFGNGIWLPYRASSERFDESGNMVCTEIMNASLIEVNKGISDDFFDGFIPDDALVSDLVRDLVYQQSDHASINGLLKETVKSKRVWMFKYTSMTLGILMILIALIKMYLKRRNAE